MTRLFIVCLIVVILPTACGGGKMGSMSNSELAAKYDDCALKNPTSPGRVTACENIKKECASRRNTGNYTC